MKKPLLIAALLMSALPCVAATARTICKLPEDAYFQAMQRRPGNKLAVYYARIDSTKKHRLLTHRILLDESSKQVSADMALPHILTGTSIDIETFNPRGQHAYLPHGQVGTTNFLRLKAGNSYRILKNLPRFDHLDSDSSLQDLKFSPDGEVLKVLGRDRLWIVGAQTGKLLRVIHPQRGKWWSRESAVLSPDGFTILGMREKITTFSARTGRVLNSFGVHIETECGGCGCREARVAFSPNGHGVLAGIDFETFYEFPVTGGKMRWEGTIPNNMHSSHDGRFYIDFKYSSKGEYLVIKNTRLHQIVEAFPALIFDDTYESPVEFSSDGKSIYFVKDNTLWQRPLTTS